MATRTFTLFPRSAEAWNFIFFFFYSLFSLLSSLKRARFLRSVFDQDRGWSPSPAFPWGSTLLSTRGVVSRLTNFLSSPVGIDFPRHFPRRSARKRVEQERAREAERERERRGGEGRAVGGRNRKTGVDCPCALGWLLERWHGDAYLRLPGVPIAGTLDTWHVCRLMKVERDPL